VNQFVPGTVTPPGFPTSKFFTALLAAQKALDGVPHDATHQNGGYTSIEHMIAHVRAALHEAGMVFVGVRGAVVQIGTQGETVDKTTGAINTIPTYAFHFTGILAHAASGEVLHVDRNQPIVVIPRARPLDMSTGAADSYNLNYLLRALLFLPRGNVADAEAEIAESEPALTEPPAPKPTETKKATEKPVEAKSAPVSEAQRVANYVALREGNLSDELLQLLAFGQSPSSMAPFDSRWLPSDPTLDELLFASWDDAAKEHGAPSAQELLAFGERDELAPPLRQALGKAVSGMLGPQAATELRTQLGATKERPLTGYTSRLLALIAGSLHAARIGFPF